MVLGVARQRSTMKSTTISVLQAHADASAAVAHVIARMSLARAASALRVVDFRQAAAPAAGVEAVPLVAVSATRSPTRRWS